MFKRNCLLGLTVVIVAVALRFGISDAYSYPQPSAEHFDEHRTISKQQLCLTIAKSFLDGSNFLKCLSRHQSDTCDPISLLYQAMDAEVNDIKGLDSNSLTKDNLFNFIGSNNDNFWKSLQNIASQCAGRFDCNSQDNSNIWKHGNIPHEIIEMIEHTQQVGTVMMSLLKNNPDDFTLNAIEDILDKFVIGIHRNNLGSQTSIGIILSQIKVLNNDMETLVSRQSQSKAPQSKQQLCHTIAQSFLDGSNFLKCLSRHQSDTCDVISLFYRAMDVQINEIKGLDNNGLTKDSLFNFISQGNANSWNTLRNIPAQCAGHSFDCSSQDNSDFSKQGNIPHEIIDMIEHTQQAGTVMMSLLNNNPDDFTLNAIEDILDTCIINVHKLNIGSQTSVGVILPQIKQVISGIEALVSRQIKPAPHAQTSKQQLCHTIAQSFLDGSNFLQCLSRHQSTTCDPISLLYKALDTELNEIKGLDNNALTKDNLFNFVGTNNENSWKRLRNIPSQCAGHNFDCNSEDNSDFSMQDNIPREIIEMIEQSQQAGTLMMNLLNNNPDDFTVNAIEDIIDKCVIGIHRSSLGSQTSLGLILSQIKLLNTDMEALVSGQLQSKVKPSKEQLCRTIATSFVDISNYLKCLSRQQLDTCDPIDLFYRAIDHQVDVIKRLNDNALTKDNLFNLFSFNIPSQCGRHSFDCNSQTDKDFVMHDNIPQEITDMIEQAQHAGSLMLRLLDSNPDDLTLNAIEDSLDMTIIRIHRNDIGSQTSVGLVLSQVIKVVSDLETLVAEHLKKAPQAPSSKVQKCQKIATLFINGANILKCLTRPQFSSCNAIGQFYQAMDFQVNEAKKLANSALTTDNLFNYLGSHYASELEHLVEVPSKCLGHSFDCNQDDYYPSIGNNIPQEVIDLLEQTQLAGNLVLQILDKHPDDVTSSAIEDILSNFVLDVHKSNTTAGTSIGLILVNVAKIIDKLQKLDFVPQQLQQYQTIGRDYVESALIMKCITQTHFSTCDSATEIYKALDIEVNAAKYHSSDVVSVDRKTKYFLHRFPNFKQNLHAILVKCEVHMENDCHHQHVGEPNVKLSQELKDFIEEFYQVGIGMGYLLEHTPTDFVINSVGEMLGYLLHGVQNSDINTSTSVRIVLDQCRIINQKLHKLEQAIAG